MSSTTINFAQNLTLKQAANLLLRVPTVRFFLQGEPGIGKSSIMAAMKKELPGHAFGYIDCSTLDLGDAGMPMVNLEEAVTYYAPNARFNLSKHSKQPVCIMLDEFTKAMEPVKNMLHPLLEAHNPRLGDIPLPPGSIVFLTGNLSSDGVGDSMKAHSRNRVTVIPVRKPSADEWVEWAVNNDVDPSVMAWVNRFPHSMASYTDGGQDENPYIFNPRKVQPAFVSPRSLEKASDIVKQRSTMDDISLIVALAGTVGEAAARDMQAFIEYQDQLPAWDNILSNPKTAPVPSSPGACAVLVFGAIAKMDKSSMPSFMSYLERFEAEWQATFCINMAKTPSKQQVAFSCKSFADWVAKNEDIL